MTENELDLFDENDAAPAGQQETEEDVTPKKETVREAVLFNTDWTVETIARQIEKGNINLDPQFQRREAWDLARKSKFIESIICGFPIPNIVLAEDPNSKGKYVVIDGKQRLFSLFSFVRNEFQLSGLVIRTDLNGKGFVELEKQFSDEVSAIENYPIRTIIIRNWPDEDYLYVVFYRLNSGSLPLSSQELRKALHGGRLLDYIDEYIQQSDAYKSVFGEKLDRRMRDVELVLRYVAFERFFNQYTGDLKKFLDDVVVFYDKNWDSEKDTLDFHLRQLEGVFSATKQIFESAAFKKWNGEDYERRINRAVFDVMARFFSDEDIRNAAVAKSNDIKARFKEICAENEQFRNSIERTTKTPKATRVRHEIWGEALAQVLGKSLDKANMRIV